MASSPPFGSAQVDLVCPTCATSVSKIYGPALPRYHEPGLSELAALLAGWLARWLAGLAGLLACSLAGLLACWLAAWSWLPDSYSKVKRIAG